MKYVVVMVKEPRPGRVKTRLGRDIGTIAASWWFRHQTARLLRNLKAQARWQLVLAVSPDRAGMFSRIWPAELARYPQGKGDLGARMRRIFRHFPPGEVVIIGADIPDIRGAHIRSAFKALGSHDVVLGAALDGGYWLVGMARKRRIAPRNFENVRWSSPYALRDTVDGLKGQRIAFIETLRDIDTVHDLDAYEAG